MIIRIYATKLFIELKINLFAPNPKGGKLIFITPFREGANKGNQVAVSGIETDIHIIKILFWFIKHILEITLYV